MRRLSRNAGIAIGPILFVIAILGVLAMAMSSSIGSFGTAGVSDRVTADVVSQAQLIRAKINECELQYEVNGVDNSAAPCAGDRYPCSDQTNGTLVSALTCPNDPLDGSNNQRNIWTGGRATQLPPPTKGFSDWQYMNGGAVGGRCIWTAPASGKNDGGTVDGLKRVAEKFTTEEVSYDNSSNTQKFVIFITTPSGSVTSKCQVP